MIADDGFAVLAGSANFESGPGAMGWRRSSYCGGANSMCVEVAVGPDDGVRVRDSKDPSGPVLVFSIEEWQTFVCGVQQGEFGC